MEYPHIDPALRKTMLAEISADSAAGTLYLSPRLNFSGEEHWEPLLRAAVERQDARWLADNLDAYKYLRKTEKERFVTVRIPFEAAHTLAESEFNRFYSRAVCRRAQEQGLTHVEIRAGRELSRAPQSARDLAGKRRKAGELYASLREATSVDKALGLKVFEPTGLSVALPES